MDHRIKVKTEVNNPEITFRSLCMDNCRMLVRISCAFISGFDLHIYI